MWHYFLINPRAWCTERFRLVLKAVHIYHSLRIVASYIVDSWDVQIFTIHDRLIGELETSCYEVIKAELILYIVYSVFLMLGYTFSLKNMFFSSVSYVFRIYGWFPKKYLFNLYRDKIREVFKVEGIFIILQGAWDLSESVFLSLLTITDQLDCV